MRLQEGERNRVIKGKNLLDLTDFVRKFRYLKGKEWCNRRGGLKHLFTM